MKDFIFVTGASGIGKTTLCRGLLAHYKTTCVEQPMVPEFISRDGVEPMSGEVEIDVAGRSAEEVLAQAVRIIDTTPSRLEYEYVKPPKELFYSWVFANGLR